MKPGPVVHINIWVTGSSGFLILRKRLKRTMRISPVSKADVFYGCRIQSMVVIRRMAGSSNKPQNLSSVKIDNQDKRQIIKIIR